MSPDAEAILPRCWAGDTNGWTSTASFPESWGRVDPEHGVDRH
jgi:hypothetical protein